MSAPKLLFLATEDWFVRSHFLPLLRRARANGFDVSVAARMSGALTDQDVRLIDMPFARGALGLPGLLREALAVHGLMRRERPDLIHAIALRPIALSLLAGAHGAKRALALTGRGYLGARKGPAARAVSNLIAARMRAAVASGDVLLVENEADRAWVERGKPLAAGAVSVLPGAGVDTTVFAAQPEPVTGPIIVGVVARLIRSKGVDVAVEAITRLQDLGVRLHIAGAADADNPDHVSEDDIARWRATPGVELLGRVSDVAGFWAGVHIACLPSRGGEGLPRSLLEAAACGRPLVTTDTPGCADFVRNGQTGLVVATDNAAALATALRALVVDADMRRAMGAAARVLVEGQYTEAHAAACASDAWRRLMAPAA